MFDVGIFTQRLAARGVRITTQAPNPADVLAVKVGSYNDLLFVLNTTYSSQQHLRQGAPRARRARTGHSAACSPHAQQGRRLERDSRARPGARSGWVPR